MAQSCGELGASWEGVGGVLRCFGKSLKVLERLGSVLEAAGRRLTQPWRSFGAPRRVLARLWGVVGRIGSDIQILGILGGLDLGLFAG